jgi:L-ascorbate metabolism protein UlaG (beta-lactamase superfamily)
MQLHFIRSATSFLHYGGAQLLLDPMLNPAGTVPPVANTANDRRNPTVDLPFGDSALLAALSTLDGVLVTHLHNDHWDARAVELLPKGLPLLCQPEDEERIRAGGFTQLLPIETDREWQGITIRRVPAQHGTGEIGQRMAPVSGFVLRHPDEPTLYIAGDTIWYDAVAATLQREQPTVTIVNAGGARFLTGDPIIMDAEDVVALCRAAPDTRVVATHLEALNHCLLSRAELRAALDAAGLAGQVAIPADGDYLDFAK